MIERLALIAPDGAFLAPYMRQAMPEVVIVGPEELGSAQAAVLISGDAVYGEGLLVDADETHPTDSASTLYRLEKETAEACAKAGIPLLTLRCAPIVGTGMTGFVRTLAAAVWRGTFFHFPGNEARISVVHATDVAKAASLWVESGASSSAVYNLTDGEHPTLHDLAEALAYRMSNKRISNLSTRPQQIIGKLIYGKHRYASYTTSRTLDSRAIESALRFSPTPVCEYLHTHVYDETSL